MRKKIVVIFLLFSIVFSCTTPIYAQQLDSNNSLSLVADNLNKLGLLAGDGNGNYNLNQPLKRTEATTFIAKLMGEFQYIQDNNETLTSNALIFKDVKENDWFAPYVGFCYSKSIVSGYSKDYFGVKDNITEQAFLVMLLKLLNYTDIKWNDNIFKKAYEIGLVSDKAYLSKTKDDNSNFTRGQVILLMNTALSIKISGQDNTVVQLLIAKDAVNADTVKSLGYDIDSKTDNDTTSQPVDLTGGNPSGSNPSGGNPSGGNPSGGGSTDSQPTDNASEFVDSIKVTNLFEVQVVFKKDMNKSSAQDKSFYEIMDKGTDKINIDSITYMHNNKTAIIKLKYDNKLTNNSTAKVTVKKGIKALWGSDSINNDIELTIKVEDLLKPEFRGFDVTSEKAIKITFSEPICDGTNNNIIDVNNFKVEYLKPEYIPQIQNISYKSYFINPVEKAELSGDSVTLFLKENVVEGNICVTLNANGTEVSTPIQDYAGNKVNKKRLIFSHAKDGKLFSEVTVKNATQASVTLGFSKPVTAKDLKLFHTDKNIEANMSTPFSTKSGDFVNEITFEFSNGIPAGKTNFFLVNSSDPSNKMLNIYGENVTDQTLVDEVVADKEPPIVKNFKLGAFNSFIIEFNEKVSKSFAENPDNYDFYTAYNAQHVSIVPKLNYDNKTVTIDIIKGLKDNTAYNVKVRNAEDIYGNIKSLIEFNFTTADNHDPMILEDKCCAINSEGKIIIYFSEPMNETQMLNASNYKVATTPGAIYTDLGAEDKVIKLSNMSVMLDLTSEVNLPNVKIKPINDLAGKYLLMASAYQIKQDVVNIKSAELISNNKVKIIFSTSLQSLAMSDISFTGVTDSAIKINYNIYSMQINDDGNTEVVVALGNELSTDGTYEGSNISVVTKAVTSSESLFGTRLTPSQNVPIDLRYFLGL